MNKLLILILCLGLTACATQRTSYIPTPTAAPKPVLAKEPGYMPIYKGMASSELIKALTVNYSACRVDAAAIRKQCGG